MISLDYLKTLAVFIKTGSMASAAKELGISQPAVSMQLRALESNCPEPLFLTEGTRKVLSPFGQKLYESTATFLIEAQKKANECLAKPGLERVSIAGRENAISYLLNKIAYLPSPLDFHICDSQEAVRKVVNHEVTFGISYQVPQSSDIIAKKLFESNPVLAFSENFNFKGTKEDILKTPFIVYRKDDPALLKFCADRNVSVGDIKIFLIAQSWSLLIDAALKGHGVAIIPLELVKRENTLKKISLTSPKFEYYLIYPKHLSKNTLIRDWIKQITN